MLMVVVGTIDQLIDGTTFILFVFYTLIILAVVILRITHPKEPHYFKVRMVHNSCQHYILSNGSCPKSHPTVEIVRTEKKHLCLPI